MTTNPPPASSRVHANAFNTTLEVSKLRASDHKVIKWIREWQYRRAHCRALLWAWVQDFQHNRFFQHRVAGCIVPRIEWTEASDENTWEPEPWHGPILSYPIEGQGYVPYRDRLVSSFRWRSITVYTAKPSGRRRQGYGSLPWKPRRLASGFGVPSSQNFAKHILANLNLTETERGDAQHEFTVYWKQLNAIWAQHCALADLTRVFNFPQHQKQIAKPMAARLEA